MSSLMSFGVNDHGDLIATTNDIHYSSLACYLEVELRKPVYCDNVLRWIARFENGDRPPEVESGNAFYMILAGEAAHIGEHSPHEAELIPIEYSISEVKDIIARWKEFLLKVRKP